MSKILLDSVTYSSENGLVLNATAYNSCNGEIEKNLGIWHRDDIKIQIIRVTWKKMI